MNKVNCKAILIGIVVLSTLAFAETWGPPTPNFTDGTTITINNPVDPGPATWTAVLDPNDAWIADLWGIQGWYDDPNNSDVQWTTEGYFINGAGAICSLNAGGYTGTIIYHFEAEEGYVFNGGTIITDLLFAGTPSTQGQVPFAGISLAHNFVLYTNNLGIMSETFDNLYDLEQFLNGTEYIATIENRTLNIPIGVSEFFLIYSDFNGYDASPVAFGYNSLSLSADLVLAPQECGDPGTVYKDSDINGDCYIDFKDFALLSVNWLNCNDPNNVDCN